MAPVENAMVPSTSALAGLKEKLPLLFLQKVTTFLRLEHLKSTVTRCFDIRITSQLVMSASELREPIEPLPIFLKGRA